MASEIQNLSKYSLNDSEKMSLIDDVLEEFREVHVLRAPELRFDYKAEYSLQEDSIPCDEKAVLLKDSDLLEEPAKYCPECGRKYPEGENVCFDCLVHLKNISDKIEISQIEYAPQFTFKGKHSFDAFDELLSMDNLSKINQFRFSIEDYSQIIHSIKLQALKNFDDIVKSNEIDFDELAILEAHIVAKLASRADGAVRQVDQNVAAVAVLLVQPELLACTDGDVEVAYLRLGIGQDRHQGGQGLRLRAEVLIDLAEGAFDEGLVLCLLLAPFAGFKDDFAAVRVFHIDLPPETHYVGVLRPRSGRFDFDRARVVFVKDVLDGVQVVLPHVGEAAAVVVPVASERLRGAVGRIGLVGGGPQP